jgi:gliding motility-associated-like protein
MFKRYFSIILLLAFVFNTNAQQDPLQIDFNAMGMPMSNSTYEVDVHVSDFDQLLGAQFFVTWDSLVLEIDTLSFISPDLPDLNPGAFALPSQTANMTKGVLRLSWFSFSFVPQTLPDDHLLFTMRFNVIGDDCDETDIDVTEIPPNLLIEISDQNFENIGAVWTPLSLQIPGTDCGGGGPMIGDEVGLIFPDVTALPGENICLPFTTVNFDSVETFQGSIMWDPDILEFTGVQNFALPGMSMGSFNLNNTMNGVASFVWFDNTGITPASIDDNGTIFEICFDVVGQLGESSDVKAFDGNTSIQISSPAPVGIRDFVVVEGSVSLEENVEGQEFGIKADTVFVDRSAGEVCVDFSTINFNDIAGMQYTLQWDPSVLTYNRIEAQVPVFASTFNPAGDDRLRYSWTNPQGVGLTLNDGTVIYRVCFDIVGDCDSSTPLNFIGETNPPRPIEITDGTFNSLPSNQIMMMDGLVNIDCGIRLEADVTDVRCNGESNGSINLMISGGQAPFDVFWEWDNGNETNQDLGVTLNSLLVGQGADTYTATVTDANGDSAIEVIEIQEPDPLEVVVTVMGSEVSLMITGGNGNYTQEFNPMIDDLNNVPDGTYTVLVSDSRNCTDTEVFMVGDIEECENPIDISTVVFSAICGDDGRIEVSCTGGSGNIQTSSSPALDFENGAFVDVPVGVYEITCEDLDMPLCSETVTVEVLQGTADDLSINISNVVNEDCSGTAGSFDVEVEGGCDPYIIQLSLDGGPFEGYNPNGDYFAGEYTVQVTDDLGNTSTETVIIEIDNSAPLELSIVEIIDAPCAGMMGEATFSLSGGCGNVTCELLAGGSTPTECALTDNGDGTFTGTYPIGAHSITFTDDFMGMSAMESFTIAISDNALSANIASVGNGSIDINVMGGQMPYEFFWMDPNEVIIGDTEDLNNLTLTGMYSVSILDAAGCSFALSVNLVGADELNLIINPVDLAFDGYGTPCAEGNCMGSINGIIVGGIPPYTLFISDSLANDLEFTFENEGAFEINELCGGSYEFMSLVDDNGMELMPAEDLNIGPIVISSPPPILIEESELNCPDEGENNGSILATVSGGTIPAGYIYTWNPDSTDPIPGPTNENLSAGVYTLIVEDSNGCETQATFDLLTDCISTDCFIGKRVITPNNDGANDVFTISCADNRSYALSIFNRWGEMVFETNNYMNDWEGIDMQGEALNEGAYYWVLDTSDRIYQGTVTLLRNQ